MLKKKGTGSLAIFLFFLCQLTKNLLQIFTPSLFKFSGNDIKISPYKTIWETIFLDQKRNI